MKNLKLYGLTGRVATALKIESLKMTEVFRSENISDFKKALVVALKKSACKSGGIGHLCEEDMEVASEVNGKVQFYVGKLPYDRGIIALVNSEVTK